MEYSSHVFLFIKPLELLFQFYCSPALTCDSKIPLMKSENSRYLSFLSDFNGHKFPVKPEMVFRLRRTYFTKDIFLLHFEVFKKEISNQYWILSHAFSIKNDRMIFFYLTRWWISSISFVLLNPSAFLQQSSLVRAFCSFSAKCISKVISPHPLSLPKRPALAPCDPLSPLFSLSRSTCQTRCSLRSSTPRDPQIPFPSACASLPTQHLHTEALSVYCLLCKMDRNHLPILSLYPWTCSVLLCSDRHHLAYYTSLLLFYIPSPQ